MMSNIYHITTKKLWEEAKRGGTCTNPSIEEVGFIHCSTKEQTVPTLNRRYAGRDDLVLLELDPEKIDTEIKYEDLKGMGEEHPHVYGEIQLGAVIRVYRLRHNNSGEFDFPKEEYETKD